MIRTILIAASLSAAPAFADVTVTDPWARASVLASRPGVVYLSLQANPADALLSLSTPLANMAMIHGVEFGKDGVARMGAIDRLPLASGEAVVLAPGGMHIMLTGLTRKLVQGESFPLILTFEKADDVTVEVPVLSVASKGRAEASE